MNLGDTIKRLEQERSKHQVAAKDHMNAADELGRMIDQMRSMPPIRTLGRIPPERKETLATGAARVLKLRGEAMSVREIADLLGKDRGSVAAACHRENHKPGGRFVRVGRGRFGLRQAERMA